MLPQNGVASGRNVMLCQVSRGATPVARSATPRARHSKGELLGVHEMPKLPDEVKQNRATARSRMEELQDIFASRHSDQCEELRFRLASLGDEVVALRTQIQTLELQLQEASAERTAREVEVFRPGKGGDPASLAANATLPEEATDDPASPARPRSANDKSGASGGENSPGGGRAELKKAATKDLYNQEVLSPILHRRRAEARFREASLVHETSISQMKAEIVEVERRMHKQQMWMRSVDEQILKAEITKTRYTIRLSAAQQRVKTLGENLSAAYENTTKMLEERLGVEDLSAKNDALITYLNVIGQADIHNANDFTPNKQELRTLMDSCKKSQQQSDRFAELVEQVHSRERLTVDITKNAAKLHHLNEQIQTLWSNVPAALKESVFYKIPRGAMMHPATAIQQMQAALLSIMEKQRDYSRVLADTVAGVGKRHCMSPHSDETHLC